MTHRDQCAKQHGLAMTRLAALPAVLALLGSATPVMSVSNGFTFVCNPEGNFGCSVWRE